MNAPTARLQNQFSIGNHYVLSALCDCSGGAGKSRGTAARASLVIVVIDFQQRELSRG